MEKQNYFCLADVWLFFELILIKTNTLNKVYNKEIHSIFNKFMQI